jgi:hypothetical protein
MQGYRRRLLHTDDAPVLQANRPGREFCFEHFNQILGKSRMRRSATLEGQELNSLYLSKRIETSHFKAEAV